MAGEIVRRAWRGVDNRRDPAHVGPEYLVRGENIDLDDARRARRRDGRTRLVTGAGFHSLWPPEEGILPFALGAQSNELKRFTLDNAGNIVETTLRSDLTAGRFLSYALAGGHVYWCNGLERGSVDGEGNARLWGIPTPPSQPTLSATTGALNPGRYQVAATFVASDGREGGARTGSRVTLDTPGGVQISGISPSGLSDIDRVRLYMTPPNGEKFYLVREVPDGTASVSVQTGLHFTVELPTQFKNPPPDGASLVAYDSGRLFVAAGNYLFVSMPFSYHLFDYHHYFPFPAEIRFLHAVPEAGVVVSADQTYFITSRFSDLGQVPLRRLARYKALPGLGAHIDGADIGEGRGSTWALWAAERGVCLMGPDGSFRNLTEERFEMPDGSRGAMIVRRLNGYVQALAMVKQRSAASNVYVGDDMQVTVRKNGITL